MKKSFSTAAFLSTAAIIVLASINVSGANACIFSEGNNLTPRNAEDPTLSSTQAGTRNLETNDNRNGLIGIAIAAVAGLAVAGIVYKVRRAGQDAYIAIAQTPQEETLDTIAFPLTVSSETRRTSTSELDQADSTADKDLTLVG